MNPAQEIRAEPRPPWLAGMIDEMGLVDAINQLVGQHPQSALVQGMWSKR